MPTVSSLDCAHSDAIVYCDDCRALCIEAARICINTPMPIAKMRNAAIISIRVKPRNRRRLAGWQRCFIGKLTAEPAASSQDRGGRCPHACGAALLGFVIERDIAS